MILIDSLDDPRLERYRFLPGRTGNLRAGDYTIVESERVAVRLLRHQWSRYVLESALMEPEAAERLAPLLYERELPPDHLFVAPKQLLERIVGYHLHQGVFLCIRIPQQPAIEQLPLPAVMLIGVSSSTNVGAIARSAAAFGFRSLICDRTSASPWLRRSIRVSMGAVFELELYHATESTPELIDRLRRCGAQLVGAEVDAPQVYTEFAWSTRDVLLFGSEGEGLSAEVLARCDAAVRIPMSSAVESLNVAAAAAVLLAWHAHVTGAAR